jgi:phosphomannomutase/phosphoglucomutase
LRRGDRAKGSAGPSGNNGARVRGHGLAAYWVRAVVGVGLILLMAVSAAVYLWVENEDTHRIRQLESCSGILVSELANRVTALQGQLRAWSADPQMRVALRTGDPEDLLSYAELLTRQIPGALKVRLFVTGTMEREGADTQHLSYAGLDLIREAERRRSVSALEVHKLGQPDVHLAVAGPVVDERREKVLGVVHIALPLALLGSTSEASGGVGRILFQQQVGDQVASLNPDTGGVVEMGPADYRADVPGTRLSVVAWLNPASVLDGDLPLYAGAVYLLLLMLIAAAMWLPLRALRRALAVDYSGVVALVEDAVNRRPLRRLQCRLSETRSIVEVLGRLLRNVQPTRSVPTLPPQPPPEQEGVDDRRTQKGASLQSREAKGGLDRIEIEEITEEPQALARGDKVAKKVPAEIFRAYDIRGIVGLDLSPALVTDIGRAVGTEAADAGDKTVIVARDTRSSSKGLADALVVGLRASGSDVLDLGIVPTPVLYFATRYQGATSGVMVTGSHNPLEYNGMKVVVGGHTLDGEHIAALRERMIVGAFTAGDGRYRQGDLIGSYIDHVERDVAIARTLKLVIDCGNAAASAVAPALYRTLGCDLTMLNCDLEADFPDGRVPDPSRPECLTLLQQRVLAEKADLGLAFDGDGDRLGVVDSSGKIISADRLLMLLASDLLSRHPGTDVIFDVKCSHHLAREILRNGGRPVMWKSGHSPLKAKIMETGALLAGEWSGHIIFQERWFGFDDALYAGARLLEVLALDPRPSAEVFAGLPEAQFSTPELFLPMAEGEPARIMDKILRLAGRLQGVELQTIDGLRVESDKGWGLVRASNTQPALTFRFEGDERGAMDEIQDLMRRVMNQVVPGVQLPF